MTKNKEEAVNTNTPKQVNVVPNTQYLKYKNFASFKNPYQLSISSNSEKPSTNVNLDLLVNPQDEEKGVYEVVIKMDIKGQRKDDELFAMDIEYGGLFTIAQINKLDDSTKEQILMIHCPAMIFPYLRKEISSETIEAGFQPLMINNIDFRSLYFKQKENQNNKDNSLN